MASHNFAPDIQTNTISNEFFSLSRLRGKKVLVKFHRFSGCPVARNQIREFIRHLPELNEAGIETVILLHSTAGKIRDNFSEVPGLHIIADREKKFYRLYQVEFSWGKLFSLSSWRATLAAIAKGFFPQFNRFEGGIIGVPSDFLVDEKGDIISGHKGKHFGDSWTASEVLKQTLAMA